MSELCCEPRMGQERPMEKKESIGEVIIANNSMARDIERSIRKLSEYIYLGPPATTEAVKEESQECMAETVEDTARILNKSLDSLYVLMTRMGL